MSASVWNPSAGTQVLSSLTRISQEFTAGVGQTTFTLLITPYTVAAQNLEVFKSGEKVLPSDVTEVTGGASFIIAACAGGEKIEAVVFPSTSAAFTTLVGEAAASAAAAAVSAAAAAVSAQEAEDANALSQFTGAAVGGDLTFVNPSPSSVHRIKGPGGTVVGYPRMSFQAISGAMMVGAMPAPSTWDGTNGFKAYSTPPVYLAVDAQTISIEIDIYTGARVVAGRSGGYASYPALKLNVGGSDVVTYSGDAATLGNMTAAVNRNSQIQYTISNTDAGSSAAARLVLQSNAGQLLLNKVSTAAGEAGGSYLTSTGGAGLFIGTSDATAVQITANGTVAASIDTNGNILAVKATGGLGYGAGAGGTVTQTTSKSTTTPAINRPNGTITMNNEALAAGASVTFSVPNSTVAALDGIVLASPAFGLSYRIEAASTAAGSFYIRVTNITAGSLSEAIAITFKVIKGSNS